MRNCANKMIKNGMFNRYVKEGKKSLKGKLMAICMNECDFVLRVSVEK